MVAVVRPLDHALPQHSLGIEQLSQQFVLVLEATQRRHVVENIWISVLQLGNDVRLSMST